MRVAILTVLMAACGVDGTAGGEHSVVTERPDAAVQISEPGNTEACDQLRDDDDKLCELACTDWHAFAALAVPGECAHAICPLLDGETFCPSACIDPKP